MNTTEPNYALEPTTMLGTSAAEQPWVPSTVVAQTLTIEEQVHAHLSASPINYIIDRLGLKRTKGQPILDALSGFSYDALFDVSDEDMLAIAQRSKFIPPNEDSFTLSYLVVNYDAPSIYFNEMTKLWTWSNCSRGREDVRSTSSNLQDIEKLYLENQRIFIRSMLARRAE